MMIKKVREYIKEHCMIREREKIVVGISGGADSVCLLFVLLELQKEWDLKLEAVHIHHGIRGADADADERFVRRLCENENVVLHVFHENVKEMAKELGMSEEEAGREIRRKHFVEVLKQTHANKIALAHHMNDSAETVLWNLCRGSKLRGLGGISPKEDVWIRPLLCAERWEIEEFLKEREIPYCIDETNMSDHYTRNKIRNHVLPYLENQVNKKSVLHIQETAKRMQEIALFMEEETKKYMESCLVKEKKDVCFLNLLKFSEVPGVLKTEIIYSILCDVAGHRKDIESRHVNMILELCEKQVGRKCDLPYGMCAIRSYDGIKIYPEHYENHFHEEKPDCKIRLLKKEEGTKTFPQNTYTKWFDYDIIKRTVEIRHRKPGDYIVIDRLGRKQKLKQYFINEKIPREIRDQIWLAADGDQIMWIIGYRQSQAYQITEKTKHVLEIQFY